MPTIDPTEADDEEIEEALLDVKRRETKYGESLIEDEDE
jgi:hypothetical protein